MLYIAATPYNFLVIIYYFFKAFTFKAFVENDNTSKPLLKNVLIVGILELPVLIILGVFLNWDWQADFTNFGDIFGGDGVVEVFWFYHFFVALVLALTSKKFFYSTLASLLGSSAIFLTAVISSIFVSSGKVARFFGEPSCAFDFLSGLSLGRNWCMFGDNLLGFLVYAAAGGLIGTGLGVIFQNKEERDSGWKMSVVFGLIALGILLWLIIYKTFLEQFFYYY